MPPPRMRRSAAGAAHQRDGLRDPLPIGNYRSRQFYTPAARTVPTWKSVIIMRLKQLLGLCRAMALSLLKPDRVWLLLFLPSFLRYMILLRGSLRPRPLTVGSLVDQGGLSSLIALDAKIEVVTEGLEGLLDAPLWRYDAVLGRGYLLFSQPGLNRLWRWEEGEGYHPLGVGSLVPVATRAVVCMSATLACATARV